MFNRGSSGVRLGRHAPFGPGSDFDDSSFSDASLPHDDHYILQRRDTVCGLNA